MRRLPLGVALAAAIVAGSGTAGAVPSESCGTPGREELRLAGGRQLPSLAAARRLIVFEPRTPSGRPFRIYVSPESRPVHRRLTLVYRSATGHRYALSQGVAGESQARFGAFARDVARRDPCGSQGSIVRLADGNIALLIEARDRRVLDFRAGKLELQLLGAPGTFSRARALALANVLLRNR